MMISKRLFLLLFFILLFIKLEAQNVKAKEISLKRENTDSVQQANFYVAQIIDNRFLKSYLGIIQIGIYNSLQPLAFENKLEVELKNFYNHTFPKHADAKPITIRINELIVSEDTKAFNEIGKAILKLDVLQQVSMDTYEILGQYEAVSKKNTLDATKSHIKRIKDVLMDCLLQFSMDNPEFLARGELNLSENPIDTQTLTEPTKNSMYDTFFELQNNRPKIDNNIIISKEDERTGNINLTNDSTGNLDYAAYYDGIIFYVNSNLYSDDGYFVKAFKVDRFLVFNELLFEGNGFANEYLIAASKSGMPIAKERTCFILDIKTGKIHSINLQRMKKLLLPKYPDSYKVYKRYGKKDAEKVFEMLKLLFENENADEVRSILLN